MKYPKIETLYNRNQQNGWKVVPGNFRMPEFELIKTWIVTEKVDGRNHRIILHPDGQIEHRGRTDRAQFASFEIEAARAAIDDDRLRSIIDAGDEGWPETILYGELYGPKIQKGGRYRDDIGFRLFDVRIGGWWLNWSDVVDIAVRLHLQTVPALGVFDSWLPTCKAELMDLLPDGSRLEKPGEPEGVVARTDPLLVTRRGERVMWKLKVKDF
jgi:ATP-dependent RNA circularization protein (DNA/RNA ligase family)